MGILVDEYDQTGEVSGASFDRYKSFIDENLVEFPVGVRAFSAADFRYDMKHPQGLHDAWLERIELQEVATGERRDDRKLHATIAFLGPYHDGMAEFAYRDVRSYQLLDASYAEYREYREHAAHGDLLIEDFDLSEDGLLIHSFRFRWGARWFIEAFDADYVWHPFH